MRTFIICLLATLSLSGLAQKKLVMEDRTYEPQIKTVLCFPLQLIEGAAPGPAARLNAQNLLIEFDDLQQDHQNYYVRLIHCNFDWSKSSLMDLEFMTDYNEFTINDYSFSINTHIPYVHYRFQLPQVKVAGNYVAVIYRDGNRQDLILSKRFMIFDQRVALAKEDDISGLGNLRNTNQALNFTVNYGHTEIINPMENIHVTIRQNQRWDNAKTDVKPSFIRENINQMEFKFFDMDKTFQGGNEFRFVDFRSLNYPGQNTMRLEKNKKPYELFVMTDKPRSNESYSQYNDLNGNYYVANADYQQEPWISANYLYVTFTLQSPEVKGDVYVLGNFNNWSKTQETKMSYDHGQYSKRILLKQGFYDYQYWVEGPSQEANAIEGSHFQTENVYEVLVYYRPFQPHADVLIGYFLLPVNPR